MAKEPLAIDPDSELGRGPGRTEIEPVVLVRGTTRFRVIRDPDAPWATYDPESVLEGQREVAGASARKKARMKEIVYRGREEGTRPITRP